MQPAAALACIFAARAALLPVRRALRAVEGLLARDDARHARARNALTEIDHHLGRLAYAIDPSSAPGAPADDAEAPGAMGGFQAHVPAAPSVHAPIMGHAQPEAVCA